MGKIYIGSVDYCEDSPSRWDDFLVYKIGSTNQTCYARCKNSDYTIFAAADYPDITDAEMLFVEGYVRMSFNEMAEVKRQIKMDYFLVNEEELKNRHFFIRNDGKYHGMQFDKNKYTNWAISWLFIFVEEAITIVNQKRRFTNRDPLGNSRKPYSHCRFGDVGPYTY